MSRLFWNLVVLFVLVASAAAFGNFYATGTLAPCDAAAVLRAGIGRPPLRGEGFASLYECQREVVVHLYGQLTGAAPARQ